jgi:hypothetical protein
MLIFSTPFSIQVSLVVLQQNVAGAPFDTEKSS